MYAASCGYIEVVRELLKRGAKKDLKDKDGDTALSYYAERASSNKGEIKKLLGGGGVFGRMFG